MSWLNRIQPDAAKPDTASPDAADPNTEAAATGQTETSCYAVFMEGKKVGHAITTRVIDQGQVTTTQDVSLAIQRGGIPISMKTSESSVETVKGEPLSFSSTMDLGIMKMNASGVVADGKAVITTSSGGQKQEQTIDWPAGAVMAEGLRLIEQEKGLEEGTSYSVKVFSSGQMMAMDVLVTVGAREQVDLLGRVVSATKISNTFSMPGAGKITSASYVDDEMNMVKDVMPLMGMEIEMVACSREFALSKNDVYEFIDNMFVDSPRVLDDLGNAKAATYYLSPMAGTEKLVVPSSGVQAVENVDGGGVKIAIRPIEMPAGAAMPYDGDDAEAKEGLKPSAYVQSDREEIVKLAKKAIGNSTDAGEAARKIESFVAKYIDNKDLSVGYASAAEVAASRQGDCSEFAVLTAALCRAVGIPAEVATGIVYIDEFAGHRNQFGGHAWTLVYVGGKWVALDSAFVSADRGGYGPGHIMLARGNGDPGGFFELAASMGTFTIDKVEMEK